MALTWGLTDLRAKVRDLTGKVASQLANGALDDKINDYYRNVFPIDVKPEKLKGWYTQATSVDDSGEYTVSTDVALLFTPATVNGSDVDFYQDADEFFYLYPKYTGAPYAISDPGLAMGSSSKAAVANDAFSYSIASDSYSKAATETALSGDNLPDGKCGAWRLEIDTAGTISIVEASNNTGYDTAALAVAGLSDESSSNACMGYVTVTNASGANFVPGTTLLDASGITATFTDHFHSRRDTPLDLLYDGGVLYARPKPDQIYEIKCRQIAKPTALSGEATVSVPEWGMVVAYGTAIEMLLSVKDNEGAEELVPGYDFYKGLLNRKKLIQKNKNQRAKPRF